MIRKDLIVAVLCTFCLTSALFSLKIAGSSGYDPWVDVTEDGRINVLDLIKVAGNLGTMGDTTKNVYVMNWPVQNQETVWYSQTNSAMSTNYNASGFSRIILTWQVGGLVDPESITFYIYAFIYDPVSHAGTGNAVQTITVTQANPRDSISLAVPSEIFAFYLQFGSGTTANVNFAFYLTYA